MSGRVQNLVMMKRPGSTITDVIEAAGAWADGIVHSLPAGGPSFGAAPAL